MNTVQICGPTGQIRHALESGGVPAVVAPCFLSAHAYVCEFDDGVIILDLRSDAYLGIDAQHLCNLRARVCNWPDSSHGEQEVERGSTQASQSVIADLLDRGILTTSLTPRQQTSAASPTLALTVTSSAQARARISLAHMVQFGVALLKVGFGLRKGRLPSLLDWLRRRQTLIRHGHSIEREEAEKRLRSFLRLRAWCYTAQHRCLFDSLVLSVYLTRGLVHCTFAIGVATKPFLAHSWVQIGEYVLNDTVEHVQDFKSIFSVGGG